MMISPAGASPYAAAAALDQQWRSGDDAATSPDAAPDPSPDVVVTLGAGAAAPSTYDATGRLASARTAADGAGDDPAPADAEEGAAVPA